MRARLPVVAALLFAAMQSAVACVVPASSNDAKLLAYYAVPMAFSAEGAGRLAAGTVIVTGELTYVPTAPASISTSSGICYPAKKEHGGLTSILPRPRFIVGLGNGFSIEASYLPPVTVADATANLGAVAFAWTTPNKAIGGVLDLTLRAHATIGYVNGPITCPKSALQQTTPNGACYSNKPSDDRYSPNIIGGEVIIGSHASSLGWYAGAGYSSLSPHFQVGYTNLNGGVDNTKVDVTLSRVTAFAGASYAMSHAVALTAQLYSVPEDATTGRVGINWRVR
jgi:hypothetical protein